MKKIKHHFLTKEFEEHCKGKFFKIIILTSILIFFIGLFAGYTLGFSKALNICVNIAKEYIDIDPSRLRALLDTYIGR